MTHREFCLWLEGFFMRGGETPTAEQWQMIGARLQKILNPEQAVTDQDVSSAFADKFFGPRAYGPKSAEGSAAGVRKLTLDECAQGGRRKNDDPAKTIGDLARESLNKQVVRNMTGIPFHTPQAPFKGEGY